MKEVQHLDQHQHFLLGAANFNMGETERCLPPFGVKRIMSTSHWVKEIHMRTLYITADGCGAAVDHLAYL